METLRWYSAATFIPMAMLMVLEGAKHSVEEEKKASISPTCEHCKLQCGSPDKVSPSV